MLWTIDFDNYEWMITILLLGLGTTILGPSHSNDGWHFRILLRSLWMVMNILVEKFADIHLLVLITILYATHTLRQNNKNK